MRPNERSKQARQPTGIPFLVLRVYNDTERDQSKQLIRHCCMRLHDILCECVSVYVCASVRGCVGAWVRACVCVYVCLLCVDFKCKSVMAVAVIQGAHDCIPMHMSAKWIIGKGKCVCFILPL